ncbi:MAG: hypothetical protein E6J91_14380 [Deltaproteobacteria bacterium]|nr:MAG: hypothetical protein E6J91_14380 [Deltaproteobacteria bacterium]
MFSDHTNRVPSAFAVCITSGTDTISSPIWIPRSRCAPSAAIAVATTATANATSSVTLSAAGASTTSGAAASTAVTSTSTAVARARPPCSRISRQQCAASSSAASVPAK